MISAVKTTSSQNYDWYQPESAEILRALPVFAQDYEARLITGSKLYAKQVDEDYKGGQRDYYDNEVPTISGKMREAGEEFHQAEKSGENRFKASVVRFGDQFAKLFLTLDHFIGFEKRLANKDIQSPIKDASGLIAKKIEETLAYIESFLLPVKDDEHALHTLKVGLGSLVDNPGAAVKNYQETMSRMKARLGQALPKIIKAFSNDPSELKKYNEQHYIDARKRIA